MGGPGGQERSNQNKVINADLAIQQDQQAKSDQLFNTYMPGVTMAENYYQKLASGDPNAIFTATAPAVGQINTASQGAKQNIRQNMPRGGAEQVAEANVDTQRAGQVGNLATSSYTNAFPALASIGQGGVGLSANEIANAISAGSGASQSNQALMSADAQGKASSMGFAGSLANAAGTAVA